MTFGSRNEGKAIMTSRYYFGRGHVKTIDTGF
jgi:hypothetical protein